MEDAFAEYQKRNKNKETIDPYFEEIENKINSPIEEKKIYFKKPYILHIGRNRPFMLISNLNRKALSVASKQAEIGSPIEGWVKHGQLNQLWTYTDNDHIKSEMKGGLVLCIKNDKNQNRTQLILNKPSGKINQKWKFLSDGTIISEGTGKCIHLSGINDGSDVFLFDTTNARNQQWEVQYLFEEAFIPRNVPFMLISQLTGEALDISKGIPFDGVNVATFKKHGKSNQIWKYTPEGYIVSEMLPFPKYALDVKDMDYENGANIIIWRCHGGENQKWCFTNEGQIISMMNWKALGVRGSNMKGGNQVQMWDLHNGSSQKWYIEFVDY